MTDSAGTPGNASDRREGSRGLFFAAVATALLVVVIALAATIAYAWFYRRGAFIVVIGVWQVILGALMTILAIVIVWLLLSSLRKRPSKPERQLVAVKPPAEPRPMPPVPPAT